jgi:DNA-binding transcriptional ArsR family regulator
MGEEIMKVSIQYKDVRADFEGRPDDVYRSIVSFMEKVIPSYSLASKISYSVDLQSLIEKLRDYLAYNQAEGVFLLKPLNALSISEAIMLLCIKRYLEHGLGLAESPSINASELAKNIAKSEKTISGKLSLLLRKGYIRRLDRGDYVITMLGIKEFVEGKVEKK